MTESDLNLPNRLSQGVVNCGVAKSFHTIFPSHPHFLHNHPL